MLRMNPLRWSVYVFRLIVLAVVLSFISTPQQARADWPPFRFRLNPAYGDGKITYEIRFTSAVDWPITDLVFKLPLPPGTRFLEAEASPPTEVSFDGAEITFFTATPGQRIRGASFTLEVTDPNRTTFSTYAWIAWKGNQPGEYVTAEEVVDVTLRWLDWTPPPDSRVQLRAGATVMDDIITYTIYPTSDTGRRIWDLRVNLPIPEGTTFLSAEAPPAFTTNFNGHEVSFSTLELEARTTAGPLRVKVSSQGLAATSISTYSWASWKNVGRTVGLSIPFQETTRSGDIVVQPHAVQQVISDKAGDVPFSNYDLLSLALSHIGAHLEILFYTVGEVGPISEPVEYILYIDQDCQPETGLAEGGLGVDLRVRYRHNRGKTYLHTRNEANDGWNEIKSAEAISTVRGNQVIILLPDQVLDPAQQFCWTASAKNRTKGFSASLPADDLPDNDGSVFSPIKLVNDTGQ